MSELPFSHAFPILPASTVGAAMMSKVASSVTLLHGALPTDSKVIVTVFPASAATGV